MESINCDNPSRELEYHLAEGVLNPFIYLINTIAPPHSISQVINPSLAYGMQIETLHKDALHATCELISKSIYVTNLSRDTTVQEIEKGLKKFGPIKRGGIQVVKQKRGKYFAFVEFESATSQQLAIEASPVIIGKTSTVRKIEAHIEGKTSTCRKTSTGNHSVYPEEDYASNPVREEEIATPVREEEIATPVREEEIATPVREEEIVTLHKDGLHATSELISKSIYVTNLPHDATVQEIEKGLKKFGPIKRDGIQVVKQKRGKCFAFVEFESATSRQRAIEASPVIIGKTSTVRKIEAHIAGKTSTGRKTSTGNHSGYPEEDYASNPVQEEEIVTPVREEEIVTPVQEEEIATPVREEEIVTLHKDGLYATSELFRDNGSSQTNIIAEQGHSIHVTNLPPNATVNQIEKGFKKFGPIKRDGIQVGKNKKGKCFAFIEFESATSRQRAIEAAPVIIGKRLTGVIGKTLTSNHSR